MAEEAPTRAMLRGMFASAGLEMTERELAIVSQLHDVFVGQRAKLAGSARPESEPLLVPAFDRKLRGKETSRERNR